MAYALAIYILNLFLAFLQPRFDPSTAADIAESDVEEGAPGLPGSSSGSNKGGKSHNLHQPPCFNTDAITQA